MSITRELPHLEAAVAEESWLWLRDNAPVFAEALQQEISGGASADEVHYFVMKMTQRPALALRLRQAAVHLRSAVK